MKAKLAALLCASVLFLSACGTASGDIPDESQVKTFHVTTIDNREIPCVFIKDGFGAGLSCDWK